MNSGDDIAFSDEDDADAVAFGFNSRRSQSRSSDQFLANNTDQFEDATDDCTIDYVPRQERGVPRSSSRTESAFTNPYKTDQSSSRTESTFTNPYKTDQSSSRTESTFTNPYKKDQSASSRTESTKRINQIDLAIERVLLSQKNGRLPPYWIKSEKSAMPSLATLLLLQGR
jgi:hypothetical protein